MVVAIISLVVASTGTGLAASRVLIRRSSQIAPHAIRGRNIAKSTITSANLAAGAVGSRNIADGAVRQNNVEPGLRNLILAGASNHAAATGGGGFSPSATEVYRRAGPDNVAAGQQATIATMSGLAPGVYAIFAKSVLAANFNNQTNLATLLTRLQSGGDADAQCTLSAAGDQDVSFTPVSSPFSSTPSNVSMQITRTLSQPGDVTLSCVATLLPWQASNTTIIALKVANAPRQPVGG